jgi:porphobilinogen synthase
MRRTEALRRLVRETSLAPDDLVWPLFAVPGKKVRNPVKSMPGVFQLSVDELVAEAQAGYAAGVRSVILFGVPEQKDAIGSGAWDEAGIIPRAVRALKEQVPGLVVMTDVCLCEYTDHGHCGVLKPTKAGVPLEAWRRAQGQLTGSAPERAAEEAGSARRRAEAEPTQSEVPGGLHPPGVMTVDNDATLALLAKEAVAHAKAGADVVAPSDMMDGRVAALRKALDEEGYGDVPILSYAAKFAGAFYGPFRDAAESAPREGPGIPKDRKGYQMDPGNWREALREVALDVAEGADMVMVKPAVPYLDIVRLVRDRFDLPVAAYHVSGEYAMIKAAAEKGWIDEERVMLETLLCIRRAGADLVLTYYAKDAAALLTGKRR